MYRTITSSFWTDPKVRQLPPLGKLLLLYLITNPHTHVSGIYILPRAVMHHETGLSLATLDTLCHTLSGLGICEFDPAKDVIWVRHMMSYQGQGDKHCRSAAFHIAEDLHNSFLCKAFLDFYPAVKKYVPAAVLDLFARGIDRVSEVGPPGSRSLVPGSRILVPDPVPVPDRRRIHNSSTEDTAPEKRAPRPRDQAADVFAEKHLEHTGIPYVFEPPNFVMLAKLRKACGTPAREPPPDWDRAVVNYFASPLAQYSLSDLANPKRYAVFKNSALDEFNKQVVHAGRNGNGRFESKGEALIRKQQEQDARVDQVLRGSTRDGTRSSDSSSADPPVHPRLVGSD